MSKCKWNDKKDTIAPCERLYESKVLHSRYMGYFKYCPFCGEDLRDPEPLTPSHEEIVTKWWKRNDTEWVKVLWFDNKTGSYYVMGQEWVTTRWFTNRQSADIPPESE